MNKPSIPFLAAKGYVNTPDWITALQRAMPNEKIVLFDDMNAEDRATCTVAIVANPNPAELQDLPNLRWVHSVWAGVERLVAALENTNLKIVRLVDPQLAKTMAEAVIAWTLYLHRDIPTYAKQQKKQLWKAMDYIRPENKTIGLLGLGALGQAAAQRLLLSDFNVCGWSRNPAQVAGVECFSGDNGLKTMLQKTDILISLLPLTSETKGLLDARRFAYLPDGASFINFSRGAIVNDDDLRDVLNNRHIKHAVLDVFDVEPLPVSQWQWEHPNVTVLPHCSGPTDRETASAIVAGNIERYRNEGEIPRSIDISRGY